MHQSFLKLFVFVIIHQLFDSTGKYACLYNYHNPIIRQWRIVSNILIARMGAIRGQAPHYLPRPLFTSPRYMAASAKIVQSPV